MTKHQAQPGPSTTATSGIFGTRRKAFPSLPPASEELRHERTEHYREMLNKIPGFAFELDEGGRLTFINDTALRALGMGREEATGREFAEFIPEPAAAEGLRSALSGENPGPLEHSVLRADGSTLRVRSAFTIIVHDGRVSGVRGFATDLSEKERMGKELKKAERRRSSYESAARSGHDLRNVLCALKGGISYLQTFDFAKLRPDQIKEIGEVFADQLEAIEHGTALTEDMMQLAGAERMEWGRVELSPLLHKIAREQRSGCAEKGIAVVCECGPDLVLERADRHKLKRAIDNIVKNAIESMEGGGLLEIAAEPGVLDGRPAALLRVRDTGCGIPAGMLDSVFEPFVTTKGGSGGTGLGLAISAAIIDSHDGRISVYSKEGQGTVFEIALPV